MTASLQQLLRKSNNAFANFSSWQYVEYSELYIVPSAAKRSSTKCCAVGSNKARDKGTRTALLIERLRLYFWRGCWFPAPSTPAKDPKPQQINGRPLACPPNGYANIRINYGLMRRDARAISRIFLSYIILPRTAQTHFITVCNNCLIFLMTRQISVNIFSVLFFSPFTAK